MRRKRTVRSLAVVAVAVVLLMLSSFCVPVGAETRALSDEIVTGGISSAAGTVGELSGSELAEGLSGGDVDELGQSLTELLTAENIFKEITSHIGASLPRALSTLATLMGLLLVCAAAKGVSGGIDGEKIATAPPSSTMSNATT